MKIYALTVQDPNKPERMKVEYRTYRCDNCGYLMALSTNHHGQCSAYCHRCSWAPSFGAGHKIPALGGHTYRVCSWVSDDVDYDALSKQPTKLPDKPLQ